LGFNDREKGKGDLAVQPSLDMIEGYETMVEMISIKSIMEKRLKIEEEKSLGKGKTKQNKRQRTIEEWSTCQDKIGKYIIDDPNPPHKDQLNVKNDNERRALNREE